ncbi:ABC transporter substrate-binding protein [Paenalcaligenes niemegkensis]|uniref:ABC transporter substrate-binding protein n=1 Tax=Paenalcaligenes niemegkensis TaxID=2895469 RepID=UPI001EE94545|nr:ABC transporter substrate-binding protein [Paenalcaligenes niemegkensis]MCQ9617587.1 ABC transporter substrate-binding protein [Paenalcaligenes niemegkensis]
MKNRLLSLLWAAAFSVLALSASAQPVTVVDALGRSVTLEKPATRVVLAQARHLPVLALLHPDPVSILAGWSDEFRTSFSNEYQNYLQRFPDIANVPTVARHTADSFSVEQALAQRPDLVVLTASFAGISKGQPPEDSVLLRHFSAAGVPVIIIDFFVDPLQNTVPSLRALGSAIGQDERTESFIDLYQSHMQRVADRLADLDAEDRPPVLLHAHAGSTDCCNSPGTGTFNDMISYAGGHNIGSDVLKTVTGRLNFEYIYSSNPMVYVATGTGAGKRANAGLRIGTDVSPEEAQNSLERIIAANRLSSLPAMKAGNAHGIWHAFNDSPLHVVFIEALASWIHPERFQDVSAADTLNEINERFLTVPLKGTYMVDIQDN